MSSKVQSISWHSPFKLSLLEPSYRGCDTQKGRINYGYGRCWSSTFKCKNSLYICFSRMIPSAGTLKACWLNCKYCRTWKCFNVNVVIKKNLINVFIKSPKARYLLRTVRYRVVDIFLEVWKSKSQKKTQDPWDVLQWTIPESLYHHLLIYIKVVTDTTREGIISSFDTVLFARFLLHFLNW